MKNILAKIAIAACLISTGANATSSHTDTNVPTSNSATSSLTVASALSPYNTRSFATSTMIKDGFGRTELRFVLGTLSATVPGSVTYTYLGSDAGYENSFSGVINSEIFNNKSTLLGASVTQNNIPAGALTFAFSTQTTNPDYTVSNGSNLTTSTYGANQGVFGIVSGATIKGNSYQYVLIYNDALSTGGKDYNDLVVGVNFTPAVPEPETYAMLLAGLGLMGTIARRRKQA